ncbi:ATP-binding protein [Lentibacillus sp. Marseille-P4043]|uniref:ATP-binding protein n=1 Tax=Lentibacillus sp. Marseille-P4043 TaxID=2040293 RepID=UPI000D0B5C38|nr:ATP-binding protein [Lentibacillus sp. Marseille-P4043]
MKRDALIVPFDQNTDIVIACDNSGSIGMKLADNVSVPYDIVAYFAFRVAYMECAAAGGFPFSVTLQNFNDEQTWPSLIAGIKQGTDELGIAELPITGSTESNFSLSQSATGITVLGKRQRNEEQSYANHQAVSVAVIGSPLVGEEVIQQKEAVAPLNLFQWYCEHNSVLSVVPVGSKGILYELKQLFPNSSLHFSSDLDLKKSSGPATCFIAVYKKDEHQTIKSKAVQLFHRVAVEGGELYS